MHKTQLLFGYNKKAMDSYIDSLLETAKNKEIEVNTHLKAIDLLKEDLATYKEKEETIVELLVDAKKEAARIIEQAEQEAEERKQEVEAMIQERLKEAENDFNRLSELKTALIFQERELKSSIQQILSNYTSAVDNIALMAPTKELTNIDMTLEAGQEIIERSRHAIVDFSKKKSEKTSVSDDLPVYTFDVNAN